MLGMDGERESRDCAMIMIFPYCLIHFHFLWDYIYIYIYIYIYKTCFFCGIHEWFSRNFYQKIYKLESNTVIRCSKYIRTVMFIIFKIPKGTPLFLPTPGEVGLFKIIDSCQLAHLLPLVFYLELTKLENETNVKHLWV